MQTSLRILTAAFLAITAAACAQEPGEISRDTAPFDGIAETASISLIGNEPFWGIDIEPSGSDGAGGFTAIYSTPENIDGAAFPVTRFAGNNGVSFSGELAGAAVQIMLTPGDCNDTMSDRSYPYTATAELGDMALSGCGYTSDEPFTGEEMP